MEKKWNNVKKTTGIRRRRNHGRMEEKWNNVKKTTGIRRSNHGKESSAV